MATAINVVCMLVVGQALSVGAAAQAAPAGAEAEVAADAGPADGATVQEASGGGEDGLEVVVGTADPCAILRPGPDVLEDRIDCVPPGTEVQLMEASEGWARVLLTDGREGWMLARHFDPLATAAVPQAAGQDAAETEAQVDERQPPSEPAQGTLYETLGVVADEKPAEPPSEDEYLIRAGDELSVKFFVNNELNEDLTVRPDGRISLQLIPEVVAAGRTPRELSALLKEMYANELNRPEITVIVRSFTAYRVFVDGEVSRPAEIELSGDMTLLQSIAMAGGFKETARESAVILIRRGEDGRPVPIPVNVRHIRRGKNSAQDLALAPYDVVYVPRSNIANVNKFVDQYLRLNIPVSFGFRIDLVD